MGDQNKHFPFSASGSKRWINCPGSWKSEKAAPVSVPGDSARVGTTVHAMIEQQLRNGDKPFPPYKFSKGTHGFLDTAGDFVRFLDREEKESNGYMIKITEKMIDDCNLCLNLVYDILDKRPDATMFAEMRTVLDPDRLGGTADIVIIDGDWACVIDYKNGVVHVDIEDNTQLGIYALGILENCKAAENVNRWTLAIVQPNDITDHRPVKTTKISTSDLGILYDGVWEAMTQCEAVPFMSGNPDDYKEGDWCQWCKGSLNCPLQKQALMTLANDELPDVPDFGRDPMQPVPVADLTDTQIGWVLSHVSMIKKHMENVQAEAISRMERGANVPGFKLVESRSHRKVTDTEGLELAAEQNGWEIWQKKLGTLTQLDKQVPRKELEKFITKPRGKTVWAPETDKRPAIESLTAGIEKVDV